MHEDDEHIHDMVVVEDFAMKNNIWLWIGILYHRGTLLYFFVFSKLNTPDIKYHIREDHSDST